MTDTLTPDLTAQPLAREDAAAQKFGELVGGGPACPIDYAYTGQILEVADVADAQNNIHRITLDEATVERMARAMCAAEFPDVPPTYAWNVQFEDGQNHYRQQALAGLTAAVVRT